MGVVSYSTDGGGGRRPPVDDHVSLVCVNHLKDLGVGKLPMQRIPLLKKLFIWQNFIIYSLINSMVKYKVKLNR